MFSTKSRQVELKSTISWYSKKLMESGNEHFSRSGPSHLTSVDWNNAYHRRSVAASMVRGVYMLERDRQTGRQGSQSRAPRWWEFFQFKLFQPLVDGHDHTIFEYKPTTNYALIHGRSPSYVIAFRGTLFRLDTIIGDIELDFDVIRNGLGRTNRFKIAMKAVRGRIANSNMNIWLTGHSLGAAIAMLAGKTLAKQGIFLDAFLFNPPYVSLPIETMIKNKKVRNGLRFAGTVVKVGLAFAARSNNNKSINERDENEKEDNSFAAISGWIPCLFVNQKDDISCGYIGYFEHRKKLEDMGAREIANLTSRYSLGHIVMKAVGVNGVETSEPLHLLPSANLTVNQSCSKQLLGDHDLCQWWRTDQNLRTSVYKYK